MTSIPDPFVALSIILAIGLLPFFALVVTSYTKIIVVLGLLRQALGVAQVPPNMVLSGIALILSFYIMAPVGIAAYDELQRRSVTQVKTMADLPRVADAVSVPLKAFLGNHVNERHRSFFLRAAQERWPKEQAATLTKDDLVVLIPSFTLSELTEAFRVGVLLYLGFLVIDLVVANTLLALGMAMVSPTVMSIPFKLLLFVVLDGWARLVEALVLSYRVPS